MYFQKSVSPFTPSTFDKKYELRRSGKCHTFPGVFALGTIVLQTIMCFESLRNHLSISSGASKGESWKSILLTFFLSIFVAVVFTLLHLFRVRDEAVCLLNSAEDVERKYREKG